MPLKPGKLNTGGKRTHSADTSSSSTPVSDKQLTPDETVLPAFLCQSTAEINARFAILNVQQQHRLEHGARSDDSNASPWHTDLSKEARARNRYIDVRPWTSTRIRLKVPEGGVDYINASPIVLKGPQAADRRNYIATQGPKESGVDHFWQMVWDETGDIAVIVMLTQLTEGGRDKCHQYFPEDASCEPLQLTFTNAEGEAIQATVKIESMVHEDYSKTTVRTLQVSCQSKVKIAHHFLFHGWPDHGVPEDVDRSALLALIELSRTKNEGWGNPVIVHCSAGVGRTGTFIALEHLLAELDVGHLDQLPATQPQADPIFDTVSRLREQRMVMVQSDEQYRFLYRSLAAAFRARAKECAIAAQVDTKITADGEPVHKAMRLTRHLKTFVSTLRDRSSSRQREDRRKEAEKDIKTGVFDVAVDRERDRNTLPTTKGDDAVREMNSQDTSLPESSPSDSQAQSQDFLDPSSNADTGLTQDAHRVRLDDDSDGAEV